jgi:ABC-2 type transport system permease protein
VIDSVRSEWLKMRSTSVPLVLTLVALLVNALLIVGTFLNHGTGAHGLNKNGALVSPGYTVPHTVQQLRNLLGTGFQGYVIALLLGVLCITTEFRHKTVTTSFLVTPRRPAFVVGKLLIAAILGAGLALVMLVSSLVGGGLTLVARGGSFSALVNEIPSVAPGMILVFVLSALLGVGIGSLLNNQVAAIVATLGWFLILNSLLVNLVHGAERWVPTGAATAAANLTRGLDTSYGLFNQWQGALLMLAYGLGFGAIGSSLLTKRDIA